MKECFHCQTQIINIRKYCGPCVKKNQSERMKKWRTLNKNKIYKYNRDPHRKKYSAEKSRTGRANIKFKAIKKLGSACVQCGLEDIRCLQIDHINNDGYVSREKNKRRGLPMHIRLKWWKDIAEGLINNAQLMCANCHARKTWEHEKIKNPSYGLIEKLIAEEQINN